MKTDPAMGQPKKVITRMRYNEGPMAFLADQIMKEHQRAGYRPREFNLYRPAEAQTALKRRGFSKAGPFQSAHQYYCASDIIDERWAWFAKKDRRGRPTGAPDGYEFWDRLWDAVYIVSEKYGVVFDQRLSWDPAHIELTGWETFAHQVGKREPTRLELDQWFEEMLPKVWKAHRDQIARRKTCG